METTLALPGYQWCEHCNKNVRHMRAQEHKCPRFSQKQLPAQKRSSKPRALSKAARKFANLHRTKFFACPDCDRSFKGLSCFADHHAAKHAKDLPLSRRAVRKLMVYETRTSAKTEKPSGGNRKSLTKAKRLKGMTYADRDKILAAMGYDAYDKYLKSRLWHGIRVRVFAAGDGNCECCGEVADQIHHLRYDYRTLAGLDLSELACICRDCHQGIEFNGNGVKMSLKAANRQFHDRVKPCWQL